MIGLIKSPSLFTERGIFCLTTESDAAIYFVLVMIIVLTLIAVRLVHREAEKDTLM